MNPLIVETAGTLLAKLVSYAIEYADATAARKAELLAQTETEFSAAKAVMFGLDGALDAGNAAADAAADAKQ